MLKNRKANIDMEQLSSLVITLIVTGLILVVGLNSLSKTKTQIGGFILSHSMVNESVTWTNNTQSTLTYNTANSFTLSCGTVYNATNGVVIGSGNYTCGITGITIVNQTAFSWQSPALVSYTVRPFDSAYNATHTVVGAVVNIPAWFPLIVIVMVGGIIIGSITLYFKNK